MKTQVDYVKMTDELQAYTGEKRITDWEIKFLQTSSNYATVGMSFTDGQKKKLEEIWNAIF